MGVFFVKKHELHRFFFFFDFQTIVLWDSFVGVASLYSFSTLLMKWETLFLVVIRKKSLGLFPLYERMGYFLSFGVASVPMNKKYR